VTAPAGSPRPTAPANGPPMAKRNSQLEKIRREALRLGATKAKLVRPKSVVTAGWVRLKCQYGCDGYGCCLTCPPYSPTPEETRRVLDGYRATLLVQAKKTRAVRAMMPKLERTAFLAGHYRAFALAAGPCRLCESCEPAERGERDGCLHAEEARPAMEACGIDVFATARANGLPLEVVNDRNTEPVYYGLLLIE